MKEDKAFVGSENSKPYYLLPEEIEALRLEVQSISPEEQKELQALQRKACEQFIATYSEFIRDDQKAYLRADNVIIPDSDKLSRITEAWGDDNVDQISEKTLLNGNQYIRYQIFEPTFVNDGSGTEEEADEAVHFWAGRVAAVPLPKGYENKHLNLSFLISQKDYDAKLKAANFESESMEDFAAAAIWAGMALHEKIHGIQRHDLPLPLLEVIAYYYQDDTFQSARWASFGKGAFKRAMEFWDQLVLEYEPDVHRFAFGTLPPNASEKMRRILIQKFTPEVMQQIFGGNKIYSEVRWFTKDDDRE